MKSTAETLAVAITLAAVAALVAYLTGCGLTPKQVGDDAKLACTVVQAVDGGNAVVDSICATAPELAQLAAAIVAARSADRADSGATSRGAMKCKPVTALAMCVSGDEMLYAIRTVRATR